MGIVLLVARLLLAVVFGVAGVAKAADPRGSRRAMIGFGVSEKLASPVAWLLAAGEVMIATLLIPLNTAWVGGLAALVLMLVFALLIAVNLARGNAPDCHCFGQLHSEPVGWSTLARNLVLLGVAVVIVAVGRNNPGLSAISWASEMKPWEIVNLIFSSAVVVLLALSVNYLRRLFNQYSTLLLKIDAMKKVIDEDYAEPPVERADAAGPAEGLPIGAPAPDFSLPSIGGGSVSLRDLLARRKPVLLLFVSPNCSPCELLVPNIKEWERDYGSLLTIAVLSKGNLQENERRMATYEAEYKLLQGDSGIADEYLAKWTPAAVLVRQDGRIASRITYGDEGIRALVPQATTGSDRKRSLPIKGNGHKPEIIIGTPQALNKLGEKPPKFSATDMTGELVNSEDVLAPNTLMVFWDPKCPYCKQMVGDFERWEEERPEGAPELLFISSGDSEAVREESSRFESRFLYDPEFDVGPLFGTNRTPSAVLIDDDGRIASAPTMGRHAILALAGVRGAMVSIS